jgi:hypothetical protein
MNMQLDDSLFKVCAFNLKEIEYIGLIRRNLCDKTFVLLIYRHDDPSII